MKWFNDLFSKTTTTKENIEINIPSAFDTEYFNRFDFKITQLGILLMSYRAFYYLASEGAKKEGLSKLPKEAVEFIQKDMKDRDMSGWDNNEKAKEI